MLALRRRVRVTTWGLPSTGGTGSRPRPPAVSTGCSTGVSAAAPRRSTSGVSTGVASTAGVSTARGRGRLRLGGRLHGLDPAGRRPARQPTWAFSGLATAATSSGEGGGDRRLAPAGAARSPPWSDCSVPSCPRPRPPRRDVHPRCRRRCRRRCSRAGGRRRGCCRLDGRVLDDDAAALAVLAVLAERLDQAGADPLAGHLHQAERGDLGDLVAGAVAAQALDQAAQHQVAVGLQHHVDEVDDDDAADVAQPELADDLLGRLEVVLGDGLLEVAAGAGELAGVDVDDGHRLGAVDDQRAARGQPDLAVQALGDLLVDPVRREDVLAVGVAGVVPLEALARGRARRAAT